MGRPSKYSDELRRRAVDEVLERGRAIPEVASQLGIASPESLRRWVRRAERDRGLVADPTTEELAEINALREVADQQRTIGLPPNRGDWSAGGTSLGGLGPQRVAVVDVVAILDRVGGQLPRIVVINLNSRPDRWRFQERQARLRRVTIERFAASTAAEGRAAFPESPIADGALGLWLSNLRLAEQVRKDPGLTLVLEDDALLSLRFRQRLSSICELFPEDAWAVQAGYLTESSPRPQHHVIANIKRVLRPRSRLRQWRVRAPTMGPFYTELGNGTQAMLVRNATFGEMLRSSGPGTVGLDRAFVAAAEKHHGKLFRAHRTIAGQWFSKSEHLDDDQLVNQSA